MQDFSNESINIDDLPKFENVDFQSLNPKYKKVIVFNLVIFLTLLIALPMALLIIKNDSLPLKLWLLIAIVLPLIFSMVVIYTFRSFKNRGYAFREHDVLFKSGVLATNTIIIPYNRVQHIAVHQGFISRSLNLATVEIFTAGGNGSDLGIPGLEKEDAEKIKQLIMSKIDTSL